METKHCPYLCILQLGMHAETAFRVRHGETNHCFERARRHGQRLGVLLGPQFGILGRNMRGCLLGQLGVDTRASKHEKLANKLNRKHFLAIASAMSKTMRDRSLMILVGESTNTMRIDG